MEFKLTDIFNNKILNIIVIFITLALVLNIFQCQSRNTGLLKEKKDAEIKRNEALSNIGQLEKTINSYKRFFAKDRKDISLDLNTISNIANESQVKIISIKPAKEENYPQYIKYSFDLTIKAIGFHNLGRFISNLESSPQIFFVDKLNIKPEQRQVQPGAALIEGGAGQIYNLSADLTLSTIAMKD